MRKTIDSLEFIGRNRARIAWTAGPSNETHADVVDAYNENLLLYSDLFDDASWGVTGTPVITRGSAQGPYPLHREYAAYTIEDDDIASIEALHQDVVVPDDVVARVIALYVEKTTGVPTNYPSLSMSYSVGGVAKVGASIIDTTNGTLTDRAGFPPDASWIADAGTHWLVVVQLNNNGTGNTSLQFRFHPAFNADGTGNPDVTAVGSANIFRAMAAVGAAAQEPQRTQALDGSYTDVTLTTGGLVPRAWIGAGVTIGGTDYGIVLDNGEDWIRVGGDATVEGAAAAVVLTAPAKVALAYVNGISVLSVPLDTDDEEMEFSVPDAFTVELHELPLAEASRPNEIPYEVRPFIMWSAVVDATKYLIYRMAPDDSEDARYQVEPDNDDVQLYEVQALSNLVADGEGWNWFRVEAKTLEGRISARTLWPYHVPATPARPTNAIAAGTSPNIVVTLTT